MNLSCQAPSAPANPAGCGAEAVRTFLHTLSSGDREGLSTWLSTYTFGQDLLDYLRGHRLIPFAYHQLRQAGLLDRLPAPARDDLRMEYDGVAAQSMLHYWELAELLAALRERGVDPVVLKGTALGVVVYPTPATRPTSDIDLLVQEDQVGIVRQVLRQREYTESELDADGNLNLTRHIKAWREYPGENIVLVEAHWSLTHDPGYAQTMDSLMPHSQAVTVDFGGFTARVLDPVEQLIHACAHLLLHHTWNWDLIWLLDLRLLVAFYGSSWDWPGVVRRAQACHLAGCVQYGLELAEQWFGTFLPAEAQHALGAVRPAPRERYYLRMAGAGEVALWRWYWQQTSGAGGLRQRLGYVKTLFFPPWPYMQRRYRARSRWLAPIYYGWRVARAGLTAFDPELGREESVEGRPAH